MKEGSKSNDISRWDQMVSIFLNIAPWLAYLIIALPLPIYFLFKYFTSAQGAPEDILLAIVSFAIGSVVGILAIILLFTYRWYWEKELRNRIASDGVTVDELPWFMSELTKNERRALRRMENENRLLADAYRETLASRLTATRIISRAKRDLVQVERRIKRTQRLQTSEVSSLKEELNEDRDRLKQIRDEAQKRLGEAEARLQQIEATSSRRLTHTDLDIALKRLEATQSQLPLALEAAKIEQETLKEIEKELNDIKD
jgi:hypothetical protein